MSEKVTVVTRFIDPETGEGVELSALTADVKNQRLELQETLVLPAGITQVVSGTDFSYKIIDFDVSDRDKYPGEHVFFFFAGTSLVGGFSDTWIETVFFSSNFVPVIPEGREPYADIAFATEFFQTRLDFERFERQIATDPQRFLRALVQGADDIDREKYRGRKLRVFSFDNKEAGRQFPRIFGPSEVQASFATTDQFVPDAVKTANSVQALYRLEQLDRGHDIEGRRDLQMQGLTGITRGNNSENWDLKAARRHPLSAEAYNMLTPYLIFGVSDNPGNF